MIDIASPVLGFVLTLMLHASVLLGAAWMLERAGWLRRPGHVERVWRVALLGALCTAALVCLPRERIGGALAAAWRGGPSSSAESLGISSAAPMHAARADTDRHVLMPPVAASRSIEAREERSASNELRLPAPAIAWAAQAWAAGALALLLLTAWRGLGVYRLMHRTRRAQIVSPDRCENEIAREVAAHYGLDTPDLRFADALASPVVLPGGVVLLPRWVSSLPPGELRALLAHELAHLARRDPFWRVLHHLALAPLFLHPLAWLALRRLDALAEREADAAAAHLLGDGRPLAECLARCLEQRTPTRPAAPRFALAMAERPGAVVHRVQRLLEEDPMSYTPPSRTFTRSALALGLLAALALPSLVVTAVADTLSSGTSVNIHSGLDGESMTVRVRDNGYELDVDMEGKITFADDESDVLAMAADAEFELEETRDGVTRSIEFTPAAGGVQRAYEVEGKPQPFDAAGREWLAQALPDMFRRSGANAEARAARILKTRGVDGLLAEIDLIKSDYARSTYLGQLYGNARLDPAQQQRALELTRGIESDYELRRALGMALSSSNVEPQMQALVLDVADEIGSDYERAELLIQALDAFEIDGPMFERWSKVVEGIDSDYEHRRVLDAVLERYEGNPDAVRIALRAAKAIDSDYERRQLLDAAAGPALDDAQLRREYLDAAAGIGSDYERKEALLTLVRTGPVDAALALDILEAIDGIGSDYEAKETLVALAGAMPGESQVIDRYRQSARRLSDYERGQAEKALDRFVAL